MDFTLQFDPHEIASLAALYSDKNEPEIEREVVPRIRSMDCLNKHDLERLMNWKSPRILPRIRQNEEGFIQEVTRNAFGSHDERYRIQSLTLINGVSWPCASVILHFKFENQYPMIDFRVLWSLGYAKRPSYDFSFWQEYTSFCRSLAKEFTVSMRDLDRALWQYSKKYQG